MVCGGVGEGGKNLKDSAFNKLLSGVGGGGVVHM